MPSLFGKGNASPKGKYLELDQSGSDEEFSLSDDEKVLFKRSGEIELNLCPETRIKRAKRSKDLCKRHLPVCVAVFVVIAALVTVVVVYFRFHSFKPQTIHDISKPQTVQDGTVILEHEQNKDGWKIVFKDIVGEGSVRLLDVDGDDIDDVIISGATAFGFNLKHDGESNKFEGLRNRCESKGLAYPCLGSIIAMSGLNGSVLWSLNVRSEAFVLNCEDFDVNKDGKRDCIATGRLGQLSAFDPYQGKTLWVCEDDDILEAFWNVFHAAALPDWDNDGVPEVLVANGGNGTKSPNDNDRDPGRLVVISGATGIALRSRYLEIPDRKETYLSPVLYTPVDDGPTYILFGSGGETIPGDLMGISLKDFCSFILSDSPEICEEIKQGEYTGMNKDNNGTFIIYKGEEKGVMVPPVVVDYDSNGVRDILMTTFAGQMVLFNGDDLKPIWSANFPGMETYGTPAPGYFNSDEYLDFMVTWNLGAWMSYNSSFVTIIDGKNGSTLWSLKASSIQMASSFSIATNLEHQHSFVFKVQDREPKFKRKQFGRKKRHGDGRPESELPPIEFRKEQFDNHLGCKDDLSSFNGEVFVVNRDTLTAPIRILEIPRLKHMYDANSGCTDAQTLHAEHRGQSLTTGLMGHKSDSSNQHNDDDADEDDHDIGNAIATANHNHNGGDNYHHGDSDDVNYDNTWNDDSSEGESNGAYNLANDAADVDSDDTEDKPDSTTKEEDTEPIRKRKDVDIKMCVVNEPDIMSSGIIGEVDGDGNLDYISTLSTTSLLFDAEYCHQGRFLQLTVQKVSMEKGIFDGTFKQVPLKIKTSMKDSGVNSPAKEGKTYLPMAQQRWTQYFGTSDKNVYR